MLIHNNKNNSNNKWVLFIYSLVVLFFFACGNKESPAPPPVVVKNPVFTTATVNDISLENLVYDVSLQPAVKISFSEPLKQSTVTGAVTMADVNGVAVTVNTTLQNDDKTILIQPAAALGYLKKYSVRVGNSLMSSSGGRLQSDISKSFVTRIDSSRKFPVISDNALLDLVQQQTFKYFWDFGHPVSGLARERNTSGDIVTSGGSGFGIMAIPVAINRNFITRAQGLARMQTIVAFLKNNAVKVKGAFPHWLNGSTGAIIPFSANDNGADLVETSYLMMGLLTARQYFNGMDVAETTLRTDINTLYNNVEWDWFR
ncbi:MAG: Ig-like domain-containing protein, partial [Chitinophagaceae bacterium]|nr:Ig-like domain-containing protein [Chitinophagaceae bacterium]